MTTFEKYLIEQFGETWERSGIMEAHTSALDAAIAEAYAKGAQHQHGEDKLTQAAAQQPLVDDIQQAVDILRMQDNAGKGQSHSETTRRAAQALNVLDAALAKVKVGK